MPLYISNTNRIESLETKVRGVKSTTTTTATPPLYQWLWARNSPGNSPVSNSFEVTYFRDGNPEQSLMETFDTGSYFFPNEYPPQAYGIGTDWNSVVGFNGDLWRSPVGPDFEVKPDIFGKIATFTNTKTIESDEYMLASYVPYSSSYMTFEFVPPSSSIQRCVTYPAYCYFHERITGSGDTTWEIPVNPSIFGANCQYDIDCECILCYNKSGQNGTTAIFNQGEPCSATTTTTTSTTTTSTTTTSTTTTLAPTYEVEYLIVAGGGAGGYYNGGSSSATYYLGSGGGGAGGWISGSTEVSSSVVFPIVVGDGGLPSQESGSNSSAFSITSLGGGRGAETRFAAAIDLLTVGSGGGGASRGPSNGPNLPGVGTVGQGNNGGPSSGQFLNAAGGGGGGALTAGIVASTGSIDGGGSGKPWLDGIIYSKGGDAPGEGQDAGLLVSASDGTANTGNGGNGRKWSGNVTYPGGNGGSGVVVIRYAGSPRGTGGTIIESGSYTYHYFTASADYVA